MRDVRGSSQCAVHTKGWYDGRVEQDQEVRTRAVEACKGVIPSTEDFISGCVVQNARRYSCDLGSANSSQMGDSEHQ